ncbi:MAG TPA: LuxR C-terminal-related transcriptional regulator [Dyella sp.]|uniref:helix-turn-helix transcriptional regulator n=1 Tax=Dyella sp. TaxID=1869338 RepID=UPI002D790E1B|nr:LuxR C-terminal-related transcriptional regulator [Dyella sp.]HET6555454.1 LuxR C-terminal-related transcriptional regulator [Dyella sp.]
MSLQQVLDQWLIGVILADAHAHPSYVNRVARDLLARQDGLMDSPTGLGAASTTETRRLRHAIALMATSAQDADAANGAPCYLKLHRRARHAAPLLLRLSPLAGPPCGVALFITAPEHLQPVPREALAVAFGLTPREAALAGMLADGYDLRECARMLAMGEGTARNHLKHIFEKTVKHSQATLVATLCRTAGSCA